MKRLTQEEMAAALEKIREHRISNINKTMTDDEIKALAKRCTIASMRLSGIEVKEDWL